MRDRWERKREQKQFPASKIRKHASPLKTVTEPPAPAPREAELAAISDSVSMHGYVYFDMANGRIVTREAKPPKPPTPEEYIATLEKKVENLEASAKRYTQRCIELVDEIHARNSIIQSKNLTIEDVMGEVARKQKEINRLQDILADRDDIRVTLAHEYRFEERYV